jgi:hypothetical protein
MRATISPFVDGIGADAQIKTLTSYFVVKLVAVVLPRPPGRAAIICV